MGSSKKHKKHKDKDREKMPHEESISSCDQRPLKLVLKVGSTSTTVDRPVPSPRTVFNVPVEPIQEQAPKLTLAIDPISGEMTSSTSAKKMKKKKSKKKHRKHSHHHHHHHHHRHKSSCSHHAKSSSSIPSVLPSSAASPSQIVSIVSEPGPSTSEMPPFLEPAVVPMEVEELPREPVHLATEIPSVPRSPSRFVPRPPSPSVPKSPSRFVPRSPSPSVPRSPSKTGTLKNMSKSSYTQFLMYILKEVQRRDSQEFFAWPVTDMIAPGYSSIIREPMDLSRMKKKIEERVYESVGEMKGDVKLMCENAMTYNLPETIYFKAARKLWHFAKEKVFSKEALLHAQKMSLTMSLDQPHSQVDPSHILPDLSTVDATLSITSSQEAEETNFDLMDESEMTPEQILEQARRAAAGAAERLTLAKPAGAHFSILRQRPDGSTSLAIVGCDHGPERIMRLDDLVGRLTDGLPYLEPYKEAEKNRVNPVETIETPPFASYLPSVDSCKANISREESSLLLSTYGDELATEYAQSLLQFAGDSDYVLGMADSLLDVLTQGQHSKGLAQLKELQTERPEEEKEGEEEEEEEEGVDGNLKEAAEIISKLHDVQKKRLSSTTKATSPENEETSLAATLTSKLTALITNFAPPADVTDIRSIRKSMGIVLKGEA